MHKLAYIDGNGMIHQLYPITKFFCLLSGTVLHLVMKDYRLICTLAFSLLVLLLLIQPGVWKIKGFRFTFLTGFLLFLLYLVFDKTGSVLVFPSHKILKITSGGLAMGLRMSGRFLGIIFLSYLFILTTKPNQLAYALMKLGLPYRYGFMLVTALRLSPILEEEGKTIYKAQLVRGVKYDSFQIKKLFLLVQQFMTPLLFSAIRRADKLVFSMEGRGFGKSPSRTFRDQSSLTLLDLYFSLGLLILFTILLLLDFGVLI
jgi:energy-coupling factor transport system permease protein